MRELLQVLVNRVILRRQTKLYTVYFLDKDDRMWQTFISEYTKKDAKKRLYIELSKNNLELNEVKSIRYMIELWLDKDNVYVKDYESWG